MKRKKRSKLRSSKGEFVKSYAEFLPREMFDVLTKQSRKYLRGTGIYALYDKNDRLVYIGRASRLGSRLKRHTRRKTSWTHFSYYEFKKKRYVPHVESLILRIGKPRENKQKGKVGFQRKKNKTKLFKKEARHEMRRLKKRVERKKRSMRKDRKKISVLKNRF